jgi:hypothetical protein
MKLIFIYLLIILIIDCYSCVTAKSSQNCVDLEWRIKAINMLVEQYASYNPKSINNCSSRPDIDIYLKIVDLNRYSFEQVNNKLINYCKKNVIRMDSIICFTQQYIGFDITAMDPSICYLFSKNDTTALRIYQNDIKIDKIEFNMEGFKNYVNAKNGCNQTLLITSKFSKNWNWEIQKVVINSDDNIWH